jgi:hypothetical protein
MRRLLGGGGVRVLGGVARAGFCAGRARQRTSAPQAIAPLQKGGGGGGVKGVVSRPCAAGLYPPWRRRATHPCLKRQPWEEEG